MIDKPKIVTFRRALQRVAIFMYMLPTVLFSQEQLGMRLERYSGLYGAAINPASTAFTPHSREISLFSAGLFFQNSYGYAVNAGVPRVIRSAGKIHFYRDTFGDDQVPPDAILLDFFDIDRKMHAATQGCLSGPSALFRINEKFTVGFTSGVRWVGTTYQVPSSLRGKVIDTVSRFRRPTYVPALSGAGAAWGEFGLHFSMRTETYNGFDFAFGISPKLLIGLEAAYGKTMPGLLYTKLATDNIRFEKGDVEVGFTTDNIDLRTQTIKRPQAEGLGAAVDLGVTWALSDENGSYRWRVGASLLDFGIVNFSKSAQVHFARFDSAAFDASELFAKIKTPDELGREFSAVLLGDPRASLTDDHFQIMLPAALSLQGDVHAMENVYVSGVLVQRLVSRYKGLKRPSVLAVVPRFEHRWGSFSVPLVLDDWHTFRFGMAARVSFLYFGTDNFGSIFRKKRFSGADFYIGLKINYLNEDDDGPGGRRRAKGNWRKKVKCSRF
jgi:Family of unknown function (DUF5723)